MTLFDLGSYGYAMVNEYLVFVDLVQFHLGGIIPSGIANYLVQFQGMFVVSWNEEPKLVGC